jgi:hypothetical protein
MNKQELITVIGIFFQDRIKLQKKGKYWYNDNGLAKLLFYLESARFMDGIYINVGIYYNNLDGASSKSLPNFHDWHFNADIGYIFRNTPILVSYDINEGELNYIFEKIKNVVIPFADNYRNKDFLKTHPDIWESPWQKRVSKERLFGFADFL